MFEALREALELSGGASFLAQAFTLEVAECFLFGEVGETAVDDVNPCSQERCEDGLLGKGEHVQMNSKIMEITAGRASSSVIGIAKWNHRRTAEPEHESDAERVGDSRREKRHK